MGFAGQLRASRVPRMRFRRPAVRHAWCMPQSATYSQNFIPGYCPPLRRTPQKGAVARAAHVALERLHGAAAWLAVLAVANAPRVSVWDVRPWRRSANNVPQGLGRRSVGGVPPQLRRRPLLLCPAYCVRYSRARYSCHRHVCVVQAPPVYARSRTLLVAVAAHKASRSATSSRSPSTTTFTHRGAELTK